MGYKKINKYDQYHSLFEELIAEFEVSQYGILKDISRSWKTALSESDYLIASNEKGMTKSFFAKGLENTLEETYFELAGLKGEVGDIPLNIFLTICSKHTDSVHDRIEVKFNKIMSRKKINSEDEYHMITNKLEEFQIIEDYGYEYITCQEMLAKFESKHQI